MAIGKEDLIATDDELLIHAQLMGGCNHPDFVFEAEKVWGHRFEHAACTHCNAKAHLYGGSAGTSDPLRELKRLIPRHCQDMIAINKVLRHLERHGWRWTVQRRDGSHQFAIEKGAIRVEGRPHSDETAAAAAALTRLAKSASLAG
jgi:hypothetical protein